MDDCSIQLSPNGLTLSSDKQSYLISDNDIPLLKRGYTVPLRDQDRKSLGPVGMIFTRQKEIVARLPTGEVVQYTGSSPVGGTSSQESGLNDRSHYGYSLPYCHAGG